MWKFRPHEICATCVMCSTTARKKRTTQEPGRPPCPRESKGCSRCIGGNRHRRSNRRNPHSGRGCCRMLLSKAGRGSGSTRPGQPLQRRDLMTESTCYAAGKLQERTWRNLVDRHSSTEAHDFAGLLSTAPGCHIQSSWARPRTKCTSARPLPLLCTQKHGMSASTDGRNPQGSPSFPASAPLSLKTREIRARLD
jgi:hypothetical protein